MGSTQRSCVAALAGLLLFSYAAQGLPWLATATRVAFVLGLALALQMMATEGSLVSFRRVNKRLRGVGLLWVAFALYASVSMLATNQQPFLTAPLMLVGCSALVFLGLGRHDLAQPMVLVLVALMLVHAIATIYFWVRPEQFGAFWTLACGAAPVEAYNYQSGITTHYSINGFYLMVGLVVCLALALASRGRARVPYVVASVLLAFALLLTQKRAMPVCALVAAFVLVVMGAREHRLLRVGACVLALALGVAALGLAVPSVQASLSRLLATFQAGSLEQATSGRVQLWQYALDGWRRSPVLGEGWYTYHYIWPNGVTLTVIAHNELLDLLYWGGVVGTVLFLMPALGSLVLTCRAALRHGWRNSSQAAVLLAGLGLQVSVLVYAFTSGTLMHHPYTFVPYLFGVAVSLQAVQALDDEYGATPRVAIVTQVGKSNFGNRLQNYALQELLRRHGVLPVTLRRQQVGIASLVKDAAKLDLPGLWRHRFYRFDFRHVEFADEVLPEGDAYPQGLTERFDAFAIGSDQVWNPDYPNTGENDYLPQVPPQKKFAYAASFGVPQISANRERTAQMLNGIPCISVREEAGQKIVRDLTGREVPLVLDPTMMLGKDHWETVAKRPRGIGGVDRPYLALYLLGDPQTMDWVRQVAEERGLAIVDLTSYPAKLGPAEFVWVIAHAALVCTDSFHGSVFSILFHRPLVMFDRAGDQDMIASRIDTLCDGFGLWDLRYNRQCFDIQRAFEVDWPAVEEALREKRAFAEGFVQQAVASAGYSIE